jgi:hypothetical protein
MRLYFEWNDLLKTYLYDARHYLESIYFKATGLSLNNITVDEVNNFVDEDECLKRDNTVYMYVLDYKLYCQPGNVVYDYYQPLEWPWNIPKVDWSKLGKNVWSVIINKLEIPEKLDISSLNRQLNTWMKEDVFWKDFRSYIDSRFTIYSHMSVFETIQHVASLKKKQYTKWIDFCFCFMFQYPGFQRVMIPGSFVSNTDKNFTRVKEFCTDGICIQFRRKKSGPKIWVYYNNFRVSQIDVAKLENFIRWFMIMDDTLKINLDVFFQEKALIASFDEVESATKKIKRTF